MHKGFLSLALFLSLASVAQTASNTLPPGVAFPAQMINHLDARKAKVGDEVKLEVTANLRGPGGVVALPQGAKLIGTVVEVNDRSVGESRISFVVNKAEWHGGSMALHAVPTAVTSPKMRTVGGSGGGGASGGSGGFGDRGTGAERGGSTRGGPGTDTSAMIAAAIGQELKGTEVQETGDPKTVTAVVNAKRDVSLPSGTVVTLRQVKPPVE